MFCKSAASRAVKTMLVALTLPLLAACTVEQRLSWSPDGNKLAVIGADGVRVSVDGGLHLGEPVEPNAKLLNWSADSKKLIVVSESPCETWEEAEKQLSKDTVEAIKECASKLIAELDKSNGDFAACSAALKNNFDATHLNAALFYLYATQPDKMRKYAGKEAQLLQLGLSLSTVKSYEVEKGIKLKEALFTTDRTFESAMVSPSTEYAFFIAGGNKELLTVELKDVKKSWKSFGHGYEKYPDWDLNTDVIYALRSFPDSGKGKPTGELVSIDIKKAPKDAVKHLSDVYHSYDKVQATVDGNILFVAIRAGSLPVGKFSNLFSYNLTSGKLKKVHATSSGSRLDSFEVSPDGNSVSIPGKNNSLEILSLQNGKRSVVSPAVAEEDDDDDTFAPVWRNNQELCYNRRQAGSQKSAVALYSLQTKTSKDISSQWPSEAVAGLLDKANKTMSFEDFLNNLREGH